MGGEHICPICFATFTRPQHVGRHMRSHTGDKPYACTQCTDRFARSDLLSRHVQKTHGDGLPVKPRKDSKASTSSAEHHQPGPGFAQPRRSSDVLRQYQQQHVPRPQHPVVRRASGGGRGSGHAWSQGMSQAPGYGAGPMVGDQRDWGQNLAAGGMVGRPGGWAEVADPGQYQRHQEISQQGFRPAPQGQDQTQMVYGQSCDPTTLSEGRGDRAIRQEPEIDEEEDDWENIPGTTMPTDASYRWVGPGFAPNFGQALPVGLPHRTVFAPDGPGLHHGTPSVLVASPSAAPLSEPSPGYSSRAPSMPYANSTYSPVDQAGNPIVMVPTPLPSYLAPSPSLTMQPAGILSDHVYNSTSPEAMAMMMAGSAVTSDSPMSSYLALPGSGPMLTQPVVGAYDGPGGMEVAVAYAPTGYPYLVSGLQESPVGYGSSLSPTSNQSGRRASSERASGSNVVLGHLPAEGTTAIVPPPNGVSMRSPLFKKGRACEQCNHSKVKCDFGTPCYKCAARGLSCTYPSGRKVSAARAAKSVSSDPGPTNRPGLPPTADGLRANAAATQIIFETQDASQRSVMYGNLASQVKAEPGMAVPSAQRMARLADGRRASVVEASTGDPGFVSSAYALDGGALLAGSVPVHYNTVRPSDAFLDGSEVQMYGLPGAVHISGQASPDLHGRDERDIVQSLPESSSRRTSLASSFLEEAAAMALDGRPMSVASTNSKIRQSALGGGRESLPGTHPALQINTTLAKRPEAVRNPSLEDVKEAWRSYLAGGQVATHAAQPAFARQQVDLAHVESGPISLTPSAQAKTRPGLPHRGRSSSSPPVFLNPNTMALQVGMAGMTPRAGPDRPYDFGQYDHTVSNHADALPMHQALSATNWNRWTQATTGADEPDLTLPTGVGGSGAKGGLREDALGMQTQGSNGPAGADIYNTASSRPIAAVLQRQSGGDRMRQVIGKGVAQTLAPERAPSFNISPATSDYGFPARTTAGPSSLRPSNANQPLGVAQQHARPGNKRLASQTLMPDHTKIQAIVLEDPGMTTSGSWDSLVSGPITPTSMSMLGRRSSLPGWMGSSGVQTASPDNLTSNPPSMKQLGLPYPYLTPNLLDTISPENGFPIMGYPTPTLNGQFPFGP